MSPPRLDRRRLLRSILAAAMAPSLSGMARAADQPLSGLIRIQGGAACAPALAKIEAAFLAIHPNIVLQKTLLDDANAFAGLCTGTADIAIKGQAAWRGELEAFGDMFGYAPLALRFATGTFDDPSGTSPAPVFFVNEKNPLTALTLDQLDGIFSAQRSGGWGPNGWSSAPARGPGRIYRYWGQLGVGAANPEWNDRTIQPYGTDVTMGQWTQLIQTTIFGGGDHWNPKMMEVVAADRKGRSAGRIVADLVAGDWLGIGFAAMRDVTGVSGLRVLALSPAAGHAAVLPSTESVRSGAYPLTQTPSLFANRQPGRTLSPAIAAFLDFVLSPQGQECIGADHTFLPLDPRIAARERAKLN